MHELCGCFVSLWRKGDFVPYRIGQTTMIMFALFVVVMIVFFARFSAQQKRKQMKSIRTRFDDFPDYSQQIRENIRKSKGNDGR